MCFTTRNKKFDPGPTSATGILSTKLFDASDTKLSPLAIRPLSHSHFATHHRTAVLVWTSFFSGVMIRICYNAFAAENT